MKEIIEKFGMQISAVGVDILLIVLLSTRPELAADTKQAFINLMMLCAGFLWGSSVGSQKKDAAMNKALNTGGAPTNNADVTVNTIQP